MSAGIDGCGFRSNFGADSRSYPVSVCVLQIGDNFVYIGKWGCRSHMICCWILFTSRALSQFITISPGELLLDWKRLNTEVSIQLSSFGCGFFFFSDNDEYVTCCFIYRLPGTVFASFLARFPGDVQGWNQLRLTWEAGHDGDALEEFLKV